MINRIHMFFAQVRLTLFTWRLEWEIYNRIFPHLNKEKDHRYPFNTDEELEKHRHHGGLDALAQVELIEKQADQMGKAYGEAFRYLMYRDLDRRLRLYVELARWRIRPATCDPRFVATRA